MNANTSAVVTAAGSLRMTEKNTFRSKATANQLLSRSREPAKARYSSITGSPSCTPTSWELTNERSRTGDQDMAGYLQSETGGRIWACQPNRRWSLDHPHI